MSSKLKAAGGRRSIKQITNQRMNTHGNTKTQEVKMSEKTQLHIRDHRGPGWFFIDKEYILRYGKKLGVYGIAVYNILAMHADNGTQESYPSYSTISDLIGCSRAKVITVVGQLEKYKIIKKINRHGSDGVNISNIITLLHKDEWIPVGGDSEARLLHDMVNEVDHIVNEVDHTPDGISDGLVNEVDHIVNGTTYDGLPGRPKLDSINYTESNIYTAPAHDTHEAREPIDPIAHIFELQETHNPQAAEPDDYEKYFGSRDEFIKIFVQKTGEHPGEVVKGEIVRLGSQPDACPERWAKSIDQAIMNYSGNGKPPPIRYVEIYEHGQGDYGKYTDWMVTQGKWSDYKKNGGNENGKLGKTAERNQAINRAANTSLDPRTGKYVPVPVP